MNAFFRPRSDCSPAPGEEHVRHYSLRQPGCNTSALRRSEQQCGESLQHELGKTGTLNLLPHPLDHFDEPCDLKKNWLSLLKETVGVFLSHPSVKDEPDLEGRTAFMWAAGKGSDEVIRTMLGLTPQIDINMADKYGGTGEEHSCLNLNAGPGIWTPWTKMFPPFST